MVQNWRIDFNEKRGRSGCRALLFPVSLFLLSAISRAGMSAMLIVPGNNTVFEGPFGFSFASLNLSGAGGIVELISEKDDLIVTRVGTPAGFSEGELTFDCGAIDFTGRFRARLLDRPINGTVLYETRTFYVDWPKTTVVLPKQHRAMSSELSFFMTVENVACDSVVQGTSYTLDVVYLGTNESQRTVFEPKSTVFTQKVATLLGVGKVPFTLPCRATDEPGIYQAILRSSRDPDNPVSVSNQLDVQRSESFRLDVYQETIFPCDRQITVYYSQPKCSGNDDKIRLYREMWGGQDTVVGSGSGGEPRLEYVMEQKVRNHASSMSFPCFRFNSSIDGYCFKYVSFATSGAVWEQTTSCIPTTAVPDGSRNNGAWSPWSDWSSCSGCPPMRRRHRSCDNPTPSPRRGGIKICDGGPNHESTICEKTPCTADVTMVTTTTPPRSLTVRPSCECGCTMTDPEGLIVASSDRCRSSSVWRIVVADGLTVRLVFEDFSLDISDGQTWVKVRDGPSHMDAMLVNSFGGEKPSPVWSRRNQMLIEYMPQQQTTVSASAAVSGGGGGIDVYESRRRKIEGFTAMYTTIDDDDGGGRDLFKKRNNGAKQAIWESAVTVAGIALCVLIVIVSVAFVWYHHVRRKRLRAKLKQTPAHQALLGRKGDAGNQQSSSIDGSANVSFNDIARGGQTKASMAVRAAEVASVDNGSRHPSLQALEPMKTPGSVRSVQQSPCGRHGVRNDVGSSTPDSLRKASIQKSVSGPSPAASRRSTGRSSTTRSSAQQPPTKMSILQRGRQKEPGAPMADEEDLSPTTSYAPSAGARKTFNGRRHQQQGSSSSAKHENIHLRNRKTKEEADADDKAFIYEKRPPVEGRDSLTRDKATEDEPLSSDKDEFKNADFIPPKKSHMAQIRDLRGTRPPVKGLDLPGDHRAQKEMATTPMSVASGDLSVSLEKTALFPDATSRDESPCDFITTDEFEYDDYVSHLPGSYFTMDPQAYTLTWSQHPPWAANKNILPAVSRTNSEASVDQERTFSYR